MEVDVLEFRNPELVWTVAAGDRVDVVNDPREQNDAPQVPSPVCSGASPARM